MEQITRDSDQDFNLFISQALLKLSIFSLEVNKKYIQNEKLILFLFG